MTRSFCLVTSMRFGLLTRNGWSVCISKSKRSLCNSFSKTNSGSCKYHLSVCPNCNLLHNSQWITFPIQLSLVLYSLCVSLQYLLIIHLCHHIIINTLAIFLLIINFWFHMIGFYDIILCCYYFFLFFTPVLADGLLLEFEGQHVYSSLQNLSQYSS